MKIHTLTREQLVRRPLAEVFAFFETPENLARITPPWLKFRIVSPSPILMKEGVQLQYTVRMMGVRMRWTSLISEYDPPRRFVDEQIRGPYAYWHHTHTFSEVKGGTLVGDEVRYAMPLGMIGDVVQRLSVQRQLEDIFSYRARAIDEMFG